MSPWASLPHLPPERRKERQSPLHPGPAGHQWAQARSLAPSCSANPLQIHAPWPGWPGSLPPLLGQGPQTSPCTPGPLQPSLGHTSTGLYPVGEARRRFSAKDQRAYTPPSTQGLLPHHGPPSWTAQPNRPPKAPTDPSFPCARTPGPVFSQPDSLSPHSRWVAAYLGGPPQQCGHHPDTPTPLHRGLSHHPVQILQTGHK